ncbi:MAG: hypothetical protein IE909_19410, partial [Campylobacterales bacterium]|nr:hypothetical protein [Campylobacterales bacterium]
MQGKILDYNKEFKSGLIRGNDGNRYRFSIDDCKSTITPKIGLEVDFVVNSDKAVEIYILPQDTVEKIKDVISSATEIVPKNFDRIKKIAIGGIVIAVVIIAAAVTKDLMDEANYEAYEAEHTEQNKPKECKITAENITWTGGMEDFFPRIMRPYNVQVNATTNCDTANVKVMLFSSIGDRFVAAESTEISSGIINVYFTINSNFVTDKFYAKYVIE